MKIENPEQLSAVESAKSLHQRKLNAESSKAGRHQENQHELIRGN
jgi:hypothetical protein